MTKVKNFGRKKFYGRNLFRMVWNVFSNENLEIENFIPCKFFFMGHCRFLAKLAKIVIKWQSQNFLVDFFVWNRFRMSQNVYRIKNLEIRNFLQLKFFLGLSNRSIPLFLKSSYQNSKMEVIAKFSTPKLFHKIVIKTTIKGTKIWYFDKLPLKRLNDGIQNLTIHIMIQIMLS